jgi:1-acyl-sn-glycerol-3-phosphate acyltransferase
MEVVLDRVRAIVARLLGLAPTRVDPDRSLFDLGFDSLIAVELSVVLRNDFGIELAVLQLLKEMTIGGLADVVLQQLASRPELVLLPSKGEAVDDAHLAEVTVTSIPVAEPPVAAPAPVSTTPSAEVLRYSALDYKRLTPAQRRVQRAVIGAARPLANIEVHGAEHLATPGPYVLATNHLTLLDVPLVLSVMPRPAVIFAAPELRRYPWIDWLLADLGNAIYVDRGAGDTEAIERGLAVLRAGGVLGLSPEGVRSGQLTRAKTGAARLAAGAGVPVVPLAIWGQDELAREWRRGRRARVQIRVGEPIPAPSQSIEELVPYTSRIMGRIAAMLPPSYRGVYADDVR